MLISIKHATISMLSWIENLSTIRHACMGKIYVQRKQAHIIKADQSGQRQELKHISGCMHMDGD